MKPAIDPRKLEVLKVWYAIFCTIVDEGRPEYSEAWKLQKLKELRARLRAEAPDLDEMARQSRNRANN